MKTSLLFVLVSALICTPAALRATARTDSQTEDAIKASYTYRTVLDNKVKVDVDNGVATLTGKVRDDEHSRLAEDTAAEFPGVTRVVNRQGRQLRAEAADGGIRQGYRRRAFGAQRPPGRRADGECGKPQHDGREDRRQLDHGPGEI
jgi:hypothetical protein